MPLDSCSPGSVDRTLLHLPENRRPLDRAWRAGWGAHTGVMVEAPRSPAGCRRCCRLLSPEMACRRGLLRQLLETRHLMPKSLKPRTAGKEIKKKKKKILFLYFREST